MSGPPYIPIMDNMVKYYRQAHRMTQTELARDLALTRQSIIAIEAGRPPSLAVALRIAKYFDLSVEEIFGD